MAFGWISNVGKAVELPKLFFHPDLRLPKYHAYGEPIESFEDECKAFLDSYAKLLAEEESGRVANTTVIQVVAAAWKLKKDSWRLRKDPVVKAMIESTVPELVRKYGMTRLWKAGYADTFQRRVEEELGDNEGTMRRYRCARCGRALSAELSVKRGIGPICWGKHD